MSRQKIKSSIDNLLTLIDPKKNEETVEGKKMILEKCEEANMVPCPPESCSVASKTILKDVYAMQGDKVVQCVPPSVASPALPLKKPKSLDDRVVDTLYHINKALPKLEKIVEWRSKLSCGMHDTGNDSGKAICNATFDHDGTRKCMWSDSAAPGQRCMETVGMHVKQMKALVIRLGQLENKIQHATFKEFATNQTFQWKQSWKTTFNDWMRARQEFLQRAYAYEMLLGLNEINCTRDSRMAIRKDVCEASNKCTHVRSAHGDGRCIIKQEGNEFAQISPLWSRDPDGNLVLFSSEWKVYVQGYDVVFDELNEPQRISLNALKGRTLPGGVSALALRARRMRIWELEDIDGKKAELLRLKQQYEGYTVDVEMTDTSIQENIARLDKMIGQSLQSFRDGVSAFRAFAMSGEDVLAERDIRTKFEAATRSQPRALLHAIQKKEELTSTKKAFAFLNGVVADIEKELKTYRDQYEETMCKEESSNKEVCKQLQEHIDRLEARRSTIVKKRDRVQSRQSAIHQSIRSMETQQESDRTQYTSMYGPPPSPMDLGAFVDAYPFDYNVEKFKFAFEWEDAYLKDYAAHADRLDQLTSDILGYQALQKLLRLHANVLNTLSSFAGTLPNKIDTQDLMIDVEEMRYAFEDFSLYHDYARILKKRFGQGERPTFLKKTSLGKFDVYYVHRGDSWERWTMGDDVSWHRSVATEADMDRGDFEYYRYLDALKEPGLLTYIGFGTRNKLSDMIMETQKEMNNLQSSMSMLNDPMELMRIRESITERNKIVADAGDGRVESFELSNPGTITVTSVKSPSFMWWIGKIVDRVDGNGRWLWIVAPSHYLNEGKWVKSTRTMYIHCSTSDIKGIGTKKVSALTIDGSNNAMNEVFVEKMPTLDDKGAYVKLCSTVFVEEQVSAVKNEEHDLSAWFAEKNLVYGLSTDVKIRWLTCFGRYVNPNVTIKYGTNEDGHILIHDLIHNRAIWDLYFDNDENFFKRINLRAPTPYYRQGGWRPNVLWAFTALVPRYGAIFNVYAHHLDVVSGSYTYLPGIDTVYRLMGMDSAFAGQVYAPGDVVWLNDRSAIVLSGDDPPGTDMYRDLAAASSYPAPTRGSTAGMTNVPFYTIRYFTRKWHKGTVEAYDAEHQTIDVVLEDGTRLVRRSVSKETGASVIVSTYDGGPIVDQVAHTILVQKAYDWIKLGQLVQYPTREDGMLWVGPITEVDRVSRMVRAGDRWHGFETVVSRADAPAFQLNDSVVFKELFTRYIVGTTYEYYPTNHLQPVSSLHADGYSIVRYVVKGVEYTEGELLYVLANALLDDAPLARAGDSQLRRYPSAAPAFRVGDRVFISPSHKLITPTTTDLIAYGQWDRIRDSTVVAVNYVEIRDEEKDKDDAVLGSVPVYLMEFRYGDATGYTAVPETDLSTEGPSRSLNVHDVVQIVDPKKQTTSDFFLLQWADTAYRKQWSWEVKAFTSDPFVPRLVYVREGDGPTCDDPDALSAASYIEEMDRLRAEYFKQAGSTDLTDGSLARREEFLTTSRSGVLARAKQLSERYRPPPECFRQPPFLVRDGQVLFRVHRWNDRRYDPPVDILEEKGMYKASDETADKMYFPMWNQRGSDVLFHKAVPGTKPVFPACDGAFRWSSACNQDTRLVGRIEDMRMGMGHALVRVRAFPPDNAAMDLSKSCIEVTFWCKTMYLISVDYGREFVASRSWWQSLYEDKSDVPSYRLAGWTGQLGTFLARDGTVVLDRNADPSVPWMLKTVAFPTTAVLKDAVKTILASGNAGWKSWLGKTVYPWMVQDPTAEVPDTFADDHAPEDVAAAWLGLVQALKRNEAEGYYDDDRHLPRDVANVDQGWFAKEYPLRPYFYRIVRQT